MFRGLEQFFVFLSLNGVVEDVSSLTDSPGDMSTVQQIIDDVGLRVKNGLYDYFTDGVDPPADYSSSDYISQILETGLLADGFDYSLVVSGGYLSALNRVQFDLTVNAAGAQQVRDTSALVKSSSTESSESVTVKLALSFGLDLNRSGEFFISVRQFSAGLGSGTEDEVLLDLDTQALPKHPASDSFNSDSLDINALAQTNIKNYIRITLPVPSGDIHLMDYTLAGESFTLENGQTLSGNGTISGDVVNSGIISPGNSPGIDVIAGDYTQAGGELIIEIGGLTPGPGNSVVDDGYDQLQVGGLATLDDVLTISLINGFAPEAGQIFEFMTFGTISGDFSVFSGLWLGDGLYFKPVINEIDGTYTLEVNQLEWDTGFDFSTQAMGDAFAALLAGKTFDAISVDLDIDMDGFAAISGSFGIQKDGDDFIIAGQDATAKIQNSSFSAGVSEADIALVLKADGTKIVYAAGGFGLSGGDFMDAVGMAVMAYNDTGLDFTARDVSVAGIFVSLPDIVDNAGWIAGTGLSVNIVSYLCFPIR